ncbi:MAG TPA: AMP-binding protein [Candidatus Aphodousia gallistercoris]|nr:AMP-binding protein [Candidatus Aphodousia gallistercoris]
MTSFPWLAKYQKGVPETINPDIYPNIPAILDRLVERRASCPCFTNMGTTLTAGQTKSLSEDLAGYLQSLPGMKKGDRVAIMMPNLLQYPVSLFGILKAGFIVVNVNPLYTARELEHQLKDAGAKAIIIIENFAKTLERVIDKTPVEYVITTAVGDLFPAPKRLLINTAIKYVKKMVPPYRLPKAVSFREALAKGHARGFQPVELYNQDVALLQYTGGTTGVSKGAMLSHRNVLANVEQTGRWISVTFKEYEEVALCALPLYHIFSFTATLCFLNWGARSVLITNPRDIKGLVKECQKARFSIYTGVNTLYNALLNVPEFKNVDFSRLKMSVAGGTQIQKVVAERWKQTTGGGILEAYGLTETSPGVCGNLPDAPWDGSVGYPLPSTEVSIRGDGFRDLGQCDDPAKIPEYTGEICVKGPQVMLGYWNRPEETAGVFRDGWLRTGDVGFMASDGKITITDRKKDMILVSGFNVYPNEVEGVIASMPGILECGVVGVPHERSGETVKAVIVRKDPSITKEDVVKYCRTQLTGYKIPKQIVFVDSLPKTAVGKILRRELKDIV